LLQRNVIWLHMMLTFAANISQNFCSSLKGFPVHLNKTEV